MPEVMPLLDAVEAVQFSRWYGSVELPGPLGESILRAWIARADAGNDTSDGEPIQAARYLLKRLDDERTQREHERERAQNARILQGARDEDAKKRLIGVRRDLLILLGKLRRIDRYTVSSRWESRLPEGKPEPFADPGDGTVRLAFHDACVRCGHPAKYVGLLRTHWKEGAADAQTGLRSTASAAEVVGLCGTHSRDQQLQLVMEQMIAADAAPDTYRFGVRQRGYGAGLARMTDEFRDGYVKLGMLRP